MPELTEFKGDDLANFDGAIDAFQPNKDQTAAIASIDAWLTDGSKQTFALSGLAGTGKSSIIPTIIRLARSKGYRPKIACPTGIASVVVNEKMRAAGLGGSLADTVHSLAYRPVGSKVVEDRKDHLGRDIRNPLFERSEFDASIVLVDEASMISERVEQRLTDNPTKYIWVGDHGQLPPVGDKAISPTLANPDYVLTEIVRQAVDSPIRKLAYDVRKGLPLSTPVPGINYVKVGDAASVARGAFAGRADVVVAATNKVRRAINQNLRTLRGFGGKPHFSPGEKVIITATNRAYNVFNGETYYVERVYTRTDRHEEGELIKCDLIDRVNNRMVRGIDLGYQWRSDESYALGITAADYGDCLTCHKAQGSQYKRVIVVDEYIGWMGDMAPMWNYTACTRASEMLAVMKIS